MNRHLLDKSLDIFLQNSTFFIQIQMIILTIDVTLESFLTMQSFNYCLNQLFSLKLSLLLNSFFRWQWLLFYLIKARRKSKQVKKYTKLLQTYTNIILHKHIQNDVSADCI